MTIQGYDGKVFVSTDGATWYEVDGVMSFDADDGMDEIDTTDTKDGTHRTHVLGLQSVSANLSGQYENETNGQGTIRTKHADRGVCYLKINYNGGTEGAGAIGWKAQGRFGRAAASVRPDGVVEFSASWRSIEVPTLLT